MAKRYNPRLPAPDPPGPPAAIDPLGSPAPFGDDDRTPPVDASEVPTTDLAVAPDSGAADIVSPKRELRGVRLTNLEIQLAIKLRGQGMSYEEIGKRIGRSHEGVRTTLIEWAPTVDLAKATLLKGANDLAERVMANADVDQGMEVLDRINVLPKRDRGVDQRVQVTIGLNIEEADVGKLAVVDGIAS